ncbi:MAG TPA: glycogen synthase [Candidatus Polarisedimenticolaceae bacterium]|nr:glycogen synthase [Candidatus Polarisedimenticolaceae bacterium]
MGTPSKVCYVSAEVAPLAKTGGLGDVGRALPLELHRQGHDVRVFLPCYAQIDRAAYPLVPVDFARDVPVTLGARTYRFTLLTTRLPGSDLALYLIDCPELLHREQYYGSGADEARRFALFCRGVLESCQRMGWGPDVFHCNDWHAALVPLLLRTIYAWDTLFASSRTLMAIHNIGYQGVFAAETIAELGLGAWAHLFDPDDLAAGRVNFLRTGLVYARAISTVSPTYAQEIQTDEYGMGLQPLLRARRDVLLGILNGVDYDEWSPEIDRHLPRRYSREDLRGKLDNKRALLPQLGLVDGAQAPLVGAISRLTTQKGFDLCFEVLPELLGTRDLRFVLLGSGERRYEEYFSWLQASFPGRVCFWRGYHDELAHRIEAAADLFLMPSRYEPCGLNQLFSLRYGTIPIVRKTGGLADSVQLYDPASGEGTGFVFDHFTADGLRWALNAALDTYPDRDTWTRLMRNAMAADYSWEHQARRYVQLYAWLAAH